MEAPTPLPQAPVRRLRLKQLDAFTDHVFEGNPAGVVLDCRGLTDELMQALAREINASETAFILPPSSPAADLRIRWFTPTVEVALCGHATIASFAAMAEEQMHGMTGAGTFAFRLETKSGILPVEVRKSESSLTVFFGLPVPEFERAGQWKLDLMQMLGVQSDDFESRLPMVTAGYLYVPFRRLHVIFSMKPNFASLRQFLINRKLGGLCVFTTETVERTSAVHSRFFAPHLGIDEDPVTGSANGPLGVYLFERGLVEAPDGQLRIVGEQGDVIRRPGRVAIEVRVEEKRVTTLRIGGSAVTVFDGWMPVP
jgi:trans-2,3-dihydro-3-hydroxyanthranilate isomerase